MVKRLLFISYYFPPSGGPGVQRTLKFVKYLPDFGWHPTVLTVHPDHAAYPDFDPTLLDEIPAAARVVRTRSWDPYALFAGLQGKTKGEAVGVAFTKDEHKQGWQQRLARWIRANVFLPDARVGWVPFARHTAKKLLAAQPFDVIFTSGPPHSTHLVGRALRRRFDVPWVADFRDPWTDISYYQELPHTALARRLDATLERAVLSTADAVVSVSDGFGRLLMARADVRRYETLPNGYDAADLPGAEASFPAIQSDRFVIAHVGTLSAQQHAPGLVEALARRAAADPAWRARLEVRFVGHVDVAILDAFREAGLGDVLQLVPYVPHAEAIEHMREAHVLIAAVQRVVNNEGVVPAKVFEYLSVGMPVLGLAPPEGDLAKILRRTGGGQVFDQDDAEGIAAFLAGHAARVARGVLPTPPDATALRAFERRTLTGRLAALFDRISNRPPSTIIGEKQALADR